MLGIAGGEQGYPIGLKICVGPLGANVMADANPDVDRTSGSGATSTDPLKSPFSGLLAGDPYNSSALPCRL